MRAMPTASKDTYPPTFNQMSLAEFDRYPVGHHSTVCYRLLFFKC